MEIISTLHAELRINNRNLTKEEFLDSVRFPEMTEKKHGKYYAQKNLGRGTIEIVYEKTERYIKVITVYWL